MWTNLMYSIDDCVAVFIHGKSINIHRLAWGPYACGAPGQVPIRPMGLMKGWQNLGGIMNFS